MLLQLNKPNNQQEVKNKPTEETLEAEEVASVEAVPEVAEVAQEVVPEEAQEETTRIGFPSPSSVDSLSTT